MKNFFLNPYHKVLKDISGSLVISVGTGVFVFLFLFLFQPFGLAFFMLAGKVRILLGYGLVTSLITFIMTYIVPIIFKPLFAESKWKVINEIIYISIILLFISASNLFYTKAVFPGINLSIRNFLVFILYTFLIGIFPIVFYVVISYISYLKKNLRASQEINSGIHYRQENLTNNPGTSETLEPVEKIIIQADNGHEVFEAHPDSLLFIESEGNYINIHYLKNATVKTKLLRTSLKNAINCLGSNQGFIQCHRTYIVNLNKVNKANGNSQGLKLELCNDQVVPVSRSYINKIKSALKSKD